MRLDGARQLARSPPASSVATAARTRAGFGVALVRPKSRLTVVDGPAGPRSAARAIACASVGCGLATGAGMAARVSGACGAGDAWQAASTIATHDAAPRGQAYFTGT